MVEIRILGSIIRLGGSRGVSKRDLGWGVVSRVSFFK